MGRYLKRGPRISGETQSLDYRPRLLRSARLAQEAKGAGGLISWISLGVLQHLCHRLGYFLGNSSNLRLAHWLSGEGLESLASKFFRSLNRIELHRVQQQATRSDYYQRTQ